MKSRKEVKQADLKKELLEGQSTALLQELHLVTNQGHLNADARRKLKQVNHLYQLLAPALSDILQRYDEPVLVDVGAGKAYLGFILYELALKDTVNACVISIEERSELVKRGQAMADRLGFGRMRFVESKIEKAPLPERVHLLTALHACDTATDDAIIVGLEHNADYIVTVPCCQAESARLLKEGKPEKDMSVLSDLWGCPLHRREFGSHLTNVLRVLALESQGYQVTVTELVGWEHSLKNELIIAKRVHRENTKARQKWEALVKSVGIEPKLIRFLRTIPRLHSKDKVE